MLRTALGPAIAEWLEDPAIIEVLLNPDGRLWIDRLKDGLADRLKIGEENRWLPRRRRSRNSTGRPRRCPS